MRRDQTIGIGLITLALALTAVNDRNRLKVGEFNNRPDGALISSSLNESHEIINYFNQIRAAKGLKPISLDDRLYNLAVARSQDMDKNGYTAFTNPKTKECATMIKGRFGIKLEEPVTEGYFYYYYPAGGFGKTKLLSMKSVVDIWIQDSKLRLEEYITQPYHVGAGIGCKGSVCSLIVISKDVIENQCI
jgi:uncharacterized protein YkwD